MTVAALSRLVKLLHPAWHPFLGGATFLEHLACGLFTLAFTASFLLLRFGGSKPRLVSVLIPAAALGLAAFNLSWELCQFKGWAWYAAEPGRFQWGQVAIDQLGVLAALLYIRLRMRRTAMTPRTALSDGTSRFPKPNLLTVKKGVEPWDADASSCA